MLGEDHGGVRLDAGKTRVRSTPTLSCGDDVELRMELTARHGDSGEVTHVDSLHTKIERGHQWVRRDMGRRGGGMEGVEDVEVLRETLGTVAENTYSGERFCKPGGMIRRGK